MTSHKTPEDVEVGQYARGRADGIYRNEPLMVVVARWINPVERHNRGTEAVYVGLAEVDGFGRRSDQWRQHTLAGFNRYCRRVEPPTFLDYEEARAAAEAGKLVPLRRPAAPRSPVVIRDR